MGQLQEVHQQLLDLGYQIIAVSPDRPEKVAGVASKKQYEYTLLSDRKMSASIAFGLAYKVDAATLERLRGYGIDLEDASGEAHHLLPVPGVFVVDTSGRIHFQYVNPDYKIRLDPAILLAAAKAAS